MDRIASVFAIIALCGGSLAAKLPSAFPSCHVNDVDFSTCLAKAMEAALHSLKNGERSLGLPTIKPLMVDEMSLDLGQGPISLILNSKNISIMGLDECDVKSTTLDLKTHTLVVEAFNKYLRLDFQYKASGKILVVAVQGDGPAFFEFDDVKTKHVLTSEPYEKKGKTYWKIVDYKIDIEPGSLKCHFHELLKGNKAISEQVNKVLNTEWKQFYQQIKAPAEESFGAIFKQLAMRVFDRVPIGDIYQDI